MLNRRLLQTLFAGGLLLLGGFLTTAHAQPLRPNILFIFDTSGSMVDHDCAQPRWYKDGSALCGGIGDGSACASKTTTCATATSATCSDPDDFTKRIFGLKRAIRETLAQVGTDEANFGLMRFPQLEDANRAAVCPDQTFAADASFNPPRHWAAHYYQDPSTSVTISGGQRFGCRISSHDADQTTYGSWFTATDASGKPAFRQSLLVDVTKPPANGTTPTANDFDPPGANITEIYKWLDNQEAASNGKITDPEIRAGNFFYTSLGRTLFYARMYLDNLVKPNDPKSQCRKNIVILITDGAETCNLDPTGPFGAFSNATQLYAGGTEVYVLTDTNTGAANDSIAFYGSGQKRSQAIRVPLDDASAVKQALIQIIAEAVPKPETCNGVDDNCNGDIDNRMGKDGPLPGEGDACLCAGLTEQMVGKGMCKKGARVCAAGGFECRGCVGPSTELCNGLDDNCNGQVDEGFDIGAACDNGLLGVCKRTGTKVCSPNGMGTTCDAPVVTGGMEVCNGLDDDCDGMTDEPAQAGGKLPGEGEACGINLGKCKGGVTKCTGGKFVCEGQMGMSMPEICNNEDDDCNGLVDENLGGAACSCDPNIPLAKADEGECAAGKLVCRGNPTLSCEGCVLPKMEICDGKDNDCDGMTDEEDPGMKLCQPQWACIKWDQDPDPNQKTRCRPLCGQTGEFACVPGYVCETSTEPDFCRNARCDGVVCPANQICKEETGQCYDPCVGVECLAPQYCKRGICTDCRQDGCPVGQICVDRACVANPCLNVTCGETEYCVNGQCKSLCPQGCAAGQKCVDGQCQTDACAAITCATGNVCDPLKRDCVMNKCGLGACPGQVCVPITGECIDNPCNAVKCPNCNECKTTVDGQPQCVQLPADQCLVPQPPIYTVKTGAGCACTVPGQQGEDGRNGAAFVLATLFGAVLLRRRRR